MKRGWVGCVGFFMTAFIIGILPITGEGQTNQQVRVQTDGRGFASISNFRAGKPYIYMGQKVEVIEFEISILGKPPCFSITTMYSLFTESGAQLVGQTLGKEIQNIRHGQSYVTLIDNTNLSRAGVIRVWLECTPSMDFRQSMPTLPPLSW